MRPPPAWGWLLWWLVALVALHAHGAPLVLVEVGTGVGLVLCCIGLLVAVFRL